MSAVLPDPAGIASAGSSSASAAVDRPIVDAHEPTAAEKLEASRARLRSALFAIAHPPAKPSLLGDLHIGSFGQSLLERLRGLPGATLVLESIEQWWAQHPLRTAGSLAEEASRRYVGPIAQKNPVAIIVGGVVFGALLAASKPWRWLLRPALLLGLVPQIGAQVLKRMPLDAWLHMLSSVRGRSAPVDAATASQSASGLPRKL